MIVTIVDPRAPLSAEVSAPMSYIQVSMAGPQGPSGPAGETGPAGPQGEPGVDGQDGSSGPIGPRGEPGADGQVGPIGPQGERGLTGLTGATGPIGPTGATGPVGPTGAEGADSTVPGPQGPIGPQGLPGVDGADGPQGEQGPQGPQGPQGLKGDTGPQGESGTGGGAESHRIIVSSYRYTTANAYGNPAVGGTSRRAIPANTLHAYPFALGGPSRPLSFGVDLFAAGAAGTVMRLGVRAADSVTQRPSSLVYDLGTAPTDTTGGRLFLAPDQELPAGLYYVMFVCDGSPELRTTSTEGGFIGHDFNRLGYGFSLAPATVEPMAEAVPAMPVTLNTIAPGQPFFVTYELEAPS